MITTTELFPGVTLRCVRADRFKQGCLSFQILRPMRREEAHINALIPAVLLRGTKHHSDLRTITLRLDELYGASVGTLVRRIGNYQSVGLFCSFMEDRFTLNGDRVLEPMLDFLREILLEPVTEDGGFSRSFVESEKKNLIATIESELNDKRAYAMNSLLRAMCRGDSFGIPRLGEKEDVAAINSVEAWKHYQKILQESRIDLFYVGSAPAEEVARQLMPIFQGIERNYHSLPPQSAFRDLGGSDFAEEMDVTQGKLCLGYVTSITNRDPEFVAMQMMNTIFGAGMTSKLFMNIREKMSLCYAIGSGYYGSKGIVTVSAGIDFDKEQQTRREIARQLQDICDGKITSDEMQAAREALLSSLRGTHDAPGSIEGYYATTAISGMGLTPQQYMDAITLVSPEQVAAAARTLKLHTGFFLKGVGA